MGWSCPFRAWLASYRLPVDVEIGLHGPAGRNSQFSLPDGRLPVLRSASRLEHLRPSFPAFTEMASEYSRTARCGLICQPSRRTGCSPAALPMDRAAATLQDSDCAASPAGRCDRARHVCHDTMGPPDIVQLDDILSATMSPGLAEVSRDGITTPISILMLLLRSETLSQERSADYSFSPALSQRCLRVGVSAQRHFREAVGWWRSGLQSMSSK